MRCVSTPAEARARRSTKSPRNSRTRPGQRKPRTPPTNASHAAGRVGGGRGPAGARRGHGRSQPAISVRQPLWVKRTRTRRGGDEGGARAAAGISHHGHGREKKGVRAVPSAQWSAPRSMERSPLKPVPENPLFHPQEPTLSQLARNITNHPPSVASNFDDQRVDGGAPSGRTAVSGGSLETPTPGHHHFRSRWPPRASSPTYEF